MQITRELSTSPNFPSPRLLDELQDPPALLATRSARSSSTARVLNVKKTEAARQPALVRRAFFCSALNTRTQPLQRGSFMKKYSSREPFQQRRRASRSICRSAAPSHPPLSGFVKSERMSSPSPASHSTDVNQFL